MTVSLEKETSQNLLGFLNASLFVYVNAVLGWGSFEAIRTIMPFFLFHNLADIALGEYWHTEKTYLVHHGASSLLAVYILRMTDFTDYEHTMVYWIATMEISSIFNCARFFFKGTLWQPYLDVLFGSSFIILRPIAVYKCFNPAYLSKSPLYLTLWAIIFVLNSYWIFCIFKYSKRVKKSISEIPCIKYVIDKVYSYRELVPSEHSLRTGAVELDAIKTKCEGFIPNIESTITFALLSMMITFTLITSMIFKVALYYDNQFKLFTIGSVCVTSLYYIFNFCLEKYLPNYSALDKDKRYYILANIIKSGILAACCPYIGKIFIDGLIYNSWDNNFIWNIGCVYTLPDFVSLFMVRRMARSTIIHHVCVCIFNMWSLSNDFREENVCRGIMVYAVFSTYAYLVNFLLGSRFLIEENMKYYLSKVAMSIYILCCLVNWSWQIYYMHHLIVNVFEGIRFSLVAYVSSIALIVWDDIILIKWLNKTQKLIKNK